MTFAVLSGVNNQNFSGLCQGGRPFFDVSKINQTIPKYTCWSRDDARNSGGRRQFYAHHQRIQRIQPPVRPPANNFRPGQPNAQFTRQTGGGH